MGKLYSIIISLYRTVLPKRQVTIRYTFSLLFILATISSVAAVIVSGGDRVRMESKSDVTIGETFDVHVFADAKSAVNAVDIKIHLPEDKFTLLGVNRGGSVLTLWTKDPYIEDGIVYLEGGTFRRGFIGEHKIATLLVKSLVDGKHSLQFREASFYAGDGSGSKYVVEGLGQTDLVAYKPDDEKDMISHYHLIADLNDDKKITLADISIFMSAWANRDRIIDLNNDGKMSFRDFSIILTIFFRNR